MGLILGNALLRSLLVNSGLPLSVQEFWQDMYEVRRIGRRGAGRWGPAAVGAGVLAGHVRGEEEDWASCRLIQIGAGRGMRGWGGGPAAVDAGVVVPDVRAARREARWAAQHARDRALCWWAGGPVGDWPRRRLVCAACRQAECAPLLSVAAPVALSLSLPFFLQVIILSFGQDFPDMGTDITRQVFSVGVAAIGLAGFALVLALVEQVVLVSGGGEGVGVAAAKLPLVRLTREVCLLPSRFPGTATTHEMVQARKACGGPAFLIADRVAVCGAATRRR